MSTASRNGLMAATAYVLTIFGANWAVQRFGVVPVGFGLMAPAAVYFVGLAFTFRDLVQEWLGRWAVLACIIVGALASAVVSPTFALASAVAFLVSELADFGVYSPLRDRSWLGAVVASNIVGLVIDSIVFLWLAFRSMEFLPGQIVGKLWMTALAVLVLGALRQRVLPRHA